MDNPETPINARPKGERGVRAALGRAGLTFEERVIWPFEDGLRAVLDVVRRPFEGVAWALRRWLLWPLGDRLALLSGPGRALAGAGAVVLVAAVGVGAFALATSGDSTSAPAAPVAATASEPPAELAAAPADKSSSGTLHGAAPVFKPGGEDSSGVDSAKAIGSAPSGAAESASSSAATDTISSSPTSSDATAAAASASAAVVDGPPAGPKAIAVAREFADAFVVYETGGERSEVRRAFAATATPELSRSLLRRPPRLPADVEVPKAKVMNVVAGPSHAGVYPVSVSLLRIGVTSELRLDMEHLKDDGWRVTNVLG